VVIVAHNERVNIGPCIESVLHNSHAASEIIVVDDASDDGTAAAVAPHPIVRVLRNRSPRGAAAARNRGMRASRGALVFFLDADCTAAPGWIRTGLAALAEPGTVAVEGAVRYATPNPSILDKVPVNPFYNLNSAPAHDARHRDFAAGNVAAWRSALCATGGFDPERYPLGREDSDLGRRLMRLGEVQYVQAMEVIHRAEAWSVASLLANARRYDADVVFCKDHCDFRFRAGILLHPRFLAMLLCPLLIPLWFDVDSLRAWRFLPAFYLYLAALRLTIWRAAIREQILLI
jgi:GT2 family glycosyltransferase